MNEIPTPNAQVDTEKISKKYNARMIAGVVLLVVASFIAGRGSAQSVNLERLGIKIVNQDPGDVTSVDYSLLWQTLGVISKEYVDRPVDHTALMYGAVKGMVQALGDPHSSFLTPEEHKSFQDDLSGNFEGIGAEIAIREGVLTVVSPLSGSPAERAGIRPLDSILKINDEDSYDMSLDKAVSKIRGPKGTEVRLTVLRKGESSAQEIKIIRETIHIKSVESEVKTINGKHVAVIKLVRFGPDAKQAFSQAQAQTVNNRTSGIILDMRNNPGGLLDAAIDIASFWLSGDKIVLKEVDAKKQEILFGSRGPGNLAGIKTVVLINEGSASASEIVAGALKDHNLATIVGMKSYGKGSVQDLVSLRGGSSVKITIAKWLTPNGRTINELGIEPDVKVERTSQDYENDRDPQMDRALEMFR